MKNGRTRKGSDTKNTIRNFESVLEVFILTLIYYAIFCFCYDRAEYIPYSGNGIIVFMGVYALLMYIFIKNTDGFQFGNLHRFDLAIAQFISLLLTNMITYFQMCLIASRMVSIFPVIVMMIFDCAVIALFVYFCTILYHKIYAPHTMAMVFGSESAVKLKIKMDTRRDKYHIDDLISADDGFDAICEKLRKYDSVVLCDVPSGLRNDLLKFCYQNQIRTYASPKISDIIMCGAQSINIFDSPLLLVKGTGLTLGQRIAKRLLDIILSSVAMIVAFPVMVGVGIAIKKEDGGPVFYRQTRVTYGGKEFEILKFRSMIVDAEKEGRSIPATGGDPRITKVGKFIRATRIDELPQIWNIFKGDMSIVGPRPERSEHVEKFTKEIPEFGYRLKVKGGLTGYAQIYGKYNTGAYDKLRLDLLYIENYSILLDIKLILLTLRILFSKESTEGFEKAEKEEEMKKQILHRLKKDF